MRVRVRVRVRVIQAWVGDGKSASYFPNRLELLFMIVLALPKACVGGWWGG